LEFYESHLYPIVYLDESGFKSDTFRPKAYAKRGQTCTGVFDWNLKQTNVIGAACNGVPFGLKTQQAHKPSETLGLTTQPTPYNAQFCITFLACHYISTVAGFRLVRLLFEWVSQAV
jgi:hypothetical protein